MIISDRFFSNISTPVSKVCTCQTVSVIYVVTALYHTISFLVQAGDVKITAFSALQGKTLDVRGILALDF